MATKKKSSTKNSSKRTTSKQNYSSGNYSGKKSVRGYANASSYAKRKEMRTEVWEWLILFALIFIALCLILCDKLGVVGSSVYTVLIGVFGFSAFPLIFWLIVCMLISMFSQNSNFGFKGFLGTLFFMLLSVATHLMAKPYFTKGADCFEPLVKSGGWLGFIVGNWLEGWVGNFGACFILFVLMGIIVFVVIGVSLKKLISAAGQQAAEKGQRLQENIAQHKKENNISKAKQKIEQKENSVKKSKTKFTTEDNFSDTDDDVPESIIYFDNTYGKNENEIPSKVSSNKKDKSAGKSIETGVQTELKMLPAPEKEGYVFPSIDLLAMPKPKTGRNTKLDLMQNAKILEESLASFGVEAKVTQVNQGPAVTRYELQPKSGVKVSRIVNLSDDIALNLAAPAIRIEAPIPGKSAVGIEVPNKESATVTLREIIDSPTFTNAKSKLTFALGKSIDGDIMVADIAKMPHLLIAGATGSGKSVCINSIIVSLLYKADPNDVQMMLIDPKVVEMVVYNGIPHMITANKKAITDAKLASAALCKMVAEMERRYQEFADFNVRDITGYNEVVETMEDENYHKMPHIVIIIDELADLMMVAAKEVEESICRLAQKARAAGMHLIVATQRPSVDVVTGLIKANIPSRLAFAVSSGVDSRTILDMVGAEKLLGKGDMLFAPIGASKPTRIQGTFVSDHEVERVVAAVRSCPTPKNSVNLTDFSVNSSSSGDGDDSSEDEFLQNAIELVVRSQKCSSSQLQREFRVGFNRAARMVEEMEKRGIVSPQDAAGKRKVLMDWATFSAREE